MSDADRTPQQQAALGTSRRAVLAAASPERLYFRCPDGLGVELLSVDPARIWGLA